MASNVTLWSGRVPGLSQHRQGRWQAFKAPDAITTIDALISARQPRHATGSSFFRSGGNSCRRGPDQVIRAAARPSPLTPAIRPAFPISSAKSTVAELVQVIFV